MSAEGIQPDIPLTDLTVHQADQAPALINSEADLPHHLANENAKAGAGSDDNVAEAKLATSDYALAQALNVLKGMALGRGATATPTAN